MAAIVNEISIQRKINIALKNQKFVAFAHGAADVRFNSYKDKMLQDFDKHLVTQELQESETNKAGSQLVTEGSLRAFIGFEGGTNPAADLRLHLDTQTQMKPNPKFSSDKNFVYYQFPVKFPTEQDIYSNDLFKTPDSWSSRSWPELIEKGVGAAQTIMHFVFARLAETAAKFKKAGSRSGWGLQRKNVFGGKSFTPIRYVSEIIEKFAERFLIHK